MSLFSGIRTFNGAWSLKGSQKLEEDDLKTITSAHVAESQYGKMVCFALITGQTKWVGLSRDCSDLPIGTELDVTSIELQTLGRQGDADIVKATGSPKK